MTAFSLKGSPHCSADESKILPDPYMRLPKLVVRISYRWTRQLFT